MQDTLMVHSEECASLPQNKCCEEDIQSQKQKGRTVPMYGTIVTFSHAGKLAMSI